MSSMRTEYPRPDFKRESFVCLNGPWNFDFDDHKVGMDEKWFLDHDFAKKIEVPFAYQTKLSGIHDRTFHDVIWYERSFTVDTKEKGKDVLLHFGAVDYIAQIFVNGVLAGQHEGGDTAFTVNATPFIDWSKAEQSLCLRVFDPGEDETIPRGKQFWEEESKGIWYTPTSGIWQSVWLEYVSKQRIDHVHFTSRFEEGCEQIRVFLHGNCSNHTVKIIVSFEDELVAETTVHCIGQEVSACVDLVQNHIFRTNFHNDGRAWTPENPHLYDVKLLLVRADGSVADAVDSYFGFRKVHIENNMVYLNNKPYYQRLVLDQGYWPEGLLTAPSDEALRYDIEAAKKLGFNGCRKHQKAEDPRFLYWADKLGYLVWGECASVPTFGENQIRREMSLWAEVIERDFNHPSIICWVPLNESWGIPNIHGDRQQQHYSQAMYHLIHALDPTRLVISNDGWEQTESDICAIHNYEHGNDDEPKKQEEFKKMLSGRDELLHHPCGVWDVYAKGFENHGAPIILTEFGGIGFDVNSNEAKGWGYTSAADEEQFVKDYRRVLDDVIASPVLAGYCYTQLTDVEQEINGLMTYDRRWKCDPDVIRSINTQYRRLRVE